MNKNQLITLLSQNCGINDILNLASETLDGKYAVANVLDLCFNPNAQIAFRAAWLLENIEKLSAQHFLTICSDFMQRYTKQNNLSGQRHFTLIMMRLTKADGMRFYKLKPEDFDEVLAATFLWILNPKTPVAVQCNAIDVIFQLAKYHEWVLDELKVILEKNLVSNSAALISRSKRILKRMKSK